MKHAIDRDRGQALLHQPRLRPARASRARCAQDVGAGGARAGRLDDHPAVRQGRARGAGQAHGLREAARGGARLPPHAQVVEGEDPHRVPQLDLLRQRRLRDRVGRARVLRQAPRLQTRRRLRRDAREHVRLAADAAGGGVARRHRRSRRSGYDPIAHPRRVEQPPRPRCCATCATRATSRRASTPTTCRTRCRRRPTSTPPQERSEAPYFTSWVRQQVVDHFGPFKAFSGGLKITTSLDLDLQQAAEQHDRAAAAARLGPADRLAGGDRQQDRRGARDGRRRRLRDEPVQPRHPGPAPAGLDVQAVRADGRAAVGHLARLGRGPRGEAVRRPAQRRRESTSSSETTATRTRARSTLASATTISDNSVYAEVGHQGRHARRSRASRGGSGIRTPISTQLRDDPRRPAETA